MRYHPADWNSYTSEQRQKWHLIYSNEEKQKIVLDSYMNRITDDEGNLDKYKILEFILDMEDRIENLETPGYED